MKRLKYLYPFVRPSLKYLGYNFLFNIIFTLFSLFSIGTILPILRILFLREEGAINQSSDASKGGAGFSSGFGILQEIENLFSEKLTSLIQEEGASYTLGIVCVLCVLCFFIKNLSRYLAVFFVVKFNHATGDRLRNAIHQKLLNLNMSFFTNRKSGDIVSRASLDVDRMQSMFQMATEMIIREPLLIISTLFVLIYMSPTLTLFVCVVLPLSGFIIGKISKSLKAASAKAQEKIADILSQIQELIYGFTIIKSFNAEQQVHKKFSQTSSQYRKLLNAVAFRQDLASPFSEFAGSVTIMLTLWFGGIMVIENRSGLSPEAFIIYIVYFFQIISPIKNLLNTFYGIKKISPSIDRYFEVIHTDNPIKELENPLELKKNFKKVSFEKVSFSYPENSKKVLQEVSFEIPSGKFIAVVGSSGSGKSTISKLMTRFYDPMSGAIKLDGQDIKSYRTRDLRKLISVVNQEIILFNDSIFKNITLGFPEATEQEVIGALKKANAYDFVMQLPQGIHTHIGDSGLKLSGGQRQRICIARAIIKNAPFLILDEATSALDTVSEKAVQKAIDGLMEGRTSLVIAHRLSTIQHCDRIIVIEDGKIYEEGTPEELLNKKGMYQKLVSMQSLNNK